VVSRSGQSENLQDVRLHEIAETGAGKLHLLAMILAGFIAVPYVY